MDGYDALGSVQKQQITYTAIILLRTSETYMDIMGWGWDRTEFYLKCCYNYAV